MLGFKTKKPRERFYLLPGQGGHSFRRKQKRLLGWAVAVSLLCGLALAAAMWWAARTRF